MNSTSKPERKKRTTHEVADAKASSTSQAKKARSTVETSGILMVRCNTCKKQVEQSLCETHGSSSYLCRVCAREEEKTKNKKCAQCEKDIKEIEMDGLFFCDKACEKKHRDARTNCVCCAKRLAPHEVYVDGHQFGKAFCSPGCADKLFEKELLPALEERKKRLGLDKADCGVCGVSFLAKEMHKDPKYPDSPFCTSCMEVDEDNEGKAAPPTEVTCDFCDDKFFSKDAWTSSECPGELFCSETCLDERVYSKKAALAKKVKCDFCRKTFDSKNAYAESEVAGDFCSEECADQAVLQEGKARKANAKRASHIKVGTYVNGSRVLSAGSALGNPP